MSTLLKDLYSKTFFENFADTLAIVLPDFNKKQFETAIFTNQWHGLELKDRMRHVATVLHKFFPTHFEESAGIIAKIIAHMRSKNFKEGSLEFMFLPEYVERYGLNHFEVATKLMEQLTQFSSCEFAVRPFIIKYPEQMMHLMTLWSRHANLHVRRLASEGCRPRLPWAMALPELKKNPSPVFPILENLKNDSSKYVRRSVANNLNDISKDHPDVLLQFARKWQNISPQTDAIIKHASRTLLKQGHPDILNHYGLGSYDDLSINDFRVDTLEVISGEYLQFSFKIRNLSQVPISLRLEYGIYFRLQNGTLSRKVFKISERQLEGKGQLIFQKKHSFRVITTRKFYAGEHQVSLIVNGKEMASGLFELHLNGV